MNNRIVGSCRFVWIGGLMAAGLVCGLAQSSYGFSIRTGHDTSTSATTPATGTVTFGTTNAATARTNFISDLGGSSAVRLQGFENVSPGNFFSTGSGNRTIGTSATTTTGLKITVSGMRTPTQTPNPANGIIDQSNTDLAYGFNTTAGGQRLLRLDPGAGNSSIVFEFSQGTRGFGIFLTDYGNTNDGTTNSRPVFSALVNGSTTALHTFARFNNSDLTTPRSQTFLGIVQQPGDALITKVELRLTGVTSGKIDRFGIDDIYSASPAAVPVPPQALGTGLFAGLAWLKSKRKQRLA
jgi:hypothetical protein